MSFISGVPLLLTSNRVCRHNFGQGPGHTLSAGPVKYEVQILYTPSLFLSDVKTWVTFSPSEPSKGFLAAHHQGPLTSLKTFTTCEFIDDLCMSLHVRGRVFDDQYSYKYGEGRRTRHIDIVSYCTYVV